MDANTHLGIDQGLCGTPVSLTDGAAEVRLETTAVMAADERGLVHGGFVFGLADYAAMLAVNDPHVVLGAADVRFHAPAAVGDVVLARAQVVEEAGKKRRVEVTAARGEEELFSGSFTCFVLAQHVLAPAEDAE
jgi:acyl-coenzyme A thioesterase PaaI-like protein